MGNLFNNITEKNKQDILSSPHFNLESVQKGRNNKKKQRQEITAQNLPDGVSVTVNKPYHAMRQHFMMIPIWLDSVLVNDFKLLPDEVMVYHFFIRKTHRPKDKKATNIVQASRSTIKQDTGRSNSGLDKCLKRLEEVGLVSCIDRGTKGANGRSASYCVNYAYPTDELEQVFKYDGHQVKKNRNSNYEPIEYNNDLSLL